MVVLLLLIAVLPFVASAVPCKREFGFDKEVVIKDPVFGWITLHREHVVAHVCETLHHIRLHVSIPNHGATIECTFNKKAIGFVHSGWVGINMGAHDCLAEVREHIGGLSIRAYGNTFSVKADAYGFSPEEHAPLLHEEGCDKSETDKCPTLYRHTVSAADNPHRQLLYRGQHNGIKDGWTPALSFLAHTAHVDDTFHVYIGEAFGQCHRMMFFKDPNELVQSGWTTLKDFWAFGHQHPETVPYTVMQAWNPHRAIVMKGDQGDQDGWTRHFVFYAYDTLPSSCSGGVLYDHDEL